MNYTYEIIRDEDSENPRTEWDNATYMACWHKRYDLGDDLKNQPCPNDPEDFTKWAKSVKALYLPLYLYDHGGITMSTGSFGDRWDSGQVGWIYITRGMILKEWGWKNLTKKRVEFLEHCMSDDVKVYDQYLTGDVWGYVIKDEEGGELDSCWGFYGDEQQCKEEAEASMKILWSQSPEGRQGQLNFEGVKA